MNRKIDIGDDEFDVSHFLNEFSLQDKKDEFFKFLLKNKIILQFHYIPLYKFSIFKDKLKYKNSEKYHSSTVSVPIFHELDKNKQLKIIKKIKNFINK